MNLIKSLVILTFLAGCTFSPYVKVNYPVNTFVKVNVRTTVEICREDKSKSVCLSHEFYSMGSGVVVHDHNDQTYILTAGHVCVHEIDASLKKKISSIKTDFIVSNNKQLSFDATIHKIHEDFKTNAKPVDLCLLKTKKSTNMPSMKLALRGPEVGEPVYNIAAPGGFFFPPALPLLSGVYSGNINEYHGLVTIPAIGGSSGSPIFNRRGELVGILFAANLQLHHLSVSINYEFVRDFMKQNLERYPLF